MENAPEHNDKENSERRNSQNTEYLPTKCRITKPPPPKPAANPLQFIKINPPSQLYKKAQEQIKKVEEIKVARQEVREEAEDWQANLDNWKSSRRKLQEHIIERVVEVKKFEQEGQDRNRRKHKTFSEMMEERSRGRHKFNIPIYNDDDSNDLSDYGIGSSSSKTNSVKDVDTDDSSSILDEKDHVPSQQDNSGTNQSPNENKQNLSIENNNFINSDYKYEPKKETFSSTLYQNLSTSKPYTIKTSTSFDSKFSEPKEDTEKYTYEGAIQDYRTRIKSRINIDESIFNKQQDIIKNKEISEVQSLLPKGNLFKRKEIFEADKNNDSQLNEPARRFSEDFANSQSIKERLKSLEKCVDIPLSSDKTSPSIGSVKSRVQSFDKPLEETKNNINNNNVVKKDGNKKTICSYLMQESSSTSSLETANKNEWRKTKDVLSDRSSSPETELYMDKLNMINQDFDNLMYGRLPRMSDNNLDHYRNSNYTSSSSTELMAMSSDREDSGIHTADVSCSVSQADEQFEDPDMPSNTIPNCIEKLNRQSAKSDDNQYGRQSCDLLDSSSISGEKCQEENCPYSAPNEEKTEKHEKFSKEFLINATEQFIFDAKTDSTLNKENSYKRPVQVSKPPTDAIKEPVIEPVTEDMQVIENKVSTYENVQLSKENKPLTCETKIVESVKETPRIYENVVLQKTEPSVYENIDFISGDILAPPKLMEPPKVKPPPPPPVDICETDSIPTEPMKRLNSTKRIKKQIQIKRSSFLGLEEPISFPDPELTIEKPPDVDLFLKQESRLEKSFYKKLQGSREGGLSEVDSQDSGLEVDRGRLSSDTWCGSFPESGTPIHHGRQDSEQTNSYTSEEEEIMKKEREIIAMVEKEEKCRDSYPVSQYRNNSNFSSPTKRYPDDYEINLGNEEFKHPYVCPNQHDLDGPDSEVLKVEHELLQLEREELERQQENMMFRENQLRKHNRYSLENICDANPQSYPYNDYRKSMPELQHMPADFRKSIPDVPGYRLSQPQSISYHKSMPDIQHAYSTSVTDYSNAFPENNLIKMEHQKSLPDLDHDVKPPIFRPPPPINRQQPVMPAKVFRPYPTDQREKKNMPVLESNPMQQQQLIKRRPISAHNIHSLGAPPKPRPIPNDMWIQPKAKLETKNYNQHWLYQEAELRRLSEMNKSWPNGRPNGDKHIPDAVIHTLTQRIQNRSSFNDPRPHPRDLRPDGSPNKEIATHSYVNHPQTMGHALPMSCPSHENQDKVLSVSGKKKCSYCSNELGRGAAMIIESLCLFYHMECFKCCVCHTQLGDGFMGTDVRVRNQKLHCHNCYSSDDGVKFSCV